MKQLLDLWTVNNPCLKQTVKAVVAMEDGLYFGDNGIQATNVTVCPRTNFKSGERYDLCDIVCKQNSHAEVAAIKAALNYYESLEGGILYMIGHSYICNNCLDHLHLVGIEKAIALDTNICYTLEKGMWVQTVFGNNL
jgi:deoxycytidylate deaminase